MVLAPLPVKQGLINLGQWGGALKMNVSHWLGLGPPGAALLAWGNITGDKLL